MKGLHIGFAPALTALIATSLQNAIASANTSASVSGCTAGTDARPSRAGALRQ